MIKAVLMQKKTTQITYKPKLQFNFKSYFKYDQ